MRLKFIRLFWLSLFLTVSLSSFTQLLRCPTLESYFSKSAWNSPGDMNTNMLNSDWKQIESTSLKDISPSGIFSGNPVEIGTAFGQKYSKEIRQSVLNYKIGIAQKGINKEEFQQKLQEEERRWLLNSPEYLEEIRATANASGVPFSDLFALNALSDLEKSEPEACTSWLAVGSATKNNQSLLHKNRDLDRDPQVIVRNKPTGKYSYTAVVTEGISTAVCMGVNEYGLAICNNQITTADIDVSGIGNLRLNREILENCKTVDEVFPFLDTLNIEGGVVIFLVDIEIGAIIEISGSTHTNYEQSVITNGIGYRANHYMVLNGSTGSSTSIIRYNKAKAFLEERIGSLTIPDFNELSRHLHTKENKAILKYTSPDGSICNYHTLCGGSFEIDKQYPGELSKMWISIGLPVYSPYLPLYSGSTEIPASFLSSQIWDLAEDIADKNYGPQWGITPELQNREEVAYYQMFNLENQTRIQLNANNFTQGRVLLTEFVASQANEIILFMQNWNSSTFWRDSFYYSNALDVITSVNVLPRNITLNTQTSLLGNIVSIPIDLGEKYVVSSKFYAESIVPNGTTLTFHILDKDTNLTLLEITAAEANNTYSLESLLVHHIRIRAVFLSTNTSLSPILNDWAIFGLKSIRPISISIYYYYGAAALLCVVFVCCCCRWRKKHHRKNII